MSDRQFSKEGPACAGPVASALPLADLVRKAQVRWLLEHAEKRSRFAALRSRRLVTSPVLCSGGGAASGDVWSCTPTSFFALPGWSATPFVRLRFKASIAGPAAERAVHRFRFFFDSGDGFSDRDSRTFNIVGDVIDLDVMIALPAPAFGFALAPLDEDGDLIVERFSLLARPRLPARAEMLARRIMISLRLLSSERSRRAALKRALRKTAPALEARPAKPPPEMAEKLSLFARARRYAPHIWGICKTSGISGAAATVKRRWQGSRPPETRARRRGAPMFRKQLAAIGSIAEARKEGPFISVLMPVFNTPPHVLDEAIQSVLAQTWPNWELCICDDASTSAETLAVLDSYRGADWRIKMRRSERNLHIAKATNAAAELATGAFVAFLDHDDLIEPKALEEIARCIESDPETDLIYTDEDKLEPDGSLSEPYLKPDWSPEHLHSVMYVLHFMAVRKSLYLSLGGVDDAYSGAQDYDLALRATRLARKVVHIPKVLYHWRKIPGSAAQVVDAKPEALRSGRRALQDHVCSIAPATRVEDGLLPGTHRVRWPLDADDPVTLLILTAPSRRNVEGRGNILLVENFIDSIVAKTTYRAFELLVVASNDLPAAVRRKIAAANGRVVDYRYQGTFNFSAKMNFALGHVRTEDVILLNDDLEVISPDWIEALLEQARRPEIGAAGARLLFADGRLQHAGIVLGVNGSAAHAFYGLGRDEVGCHGMTHIVRNYSAVTGAVLATRLSILRQVGLLDTEMRVDFNDIDLCLKIGAAGYRIVYTPYAELYHFEGQSLRRSAQDERDTAAFLERWGDAVSRDPYYHPRLPRSRTDFHIAQWLEDDVAAIDATLIGDEHRRQRRKAIAAVAASLAPGGLRDGTSFDGQKAEIVASGLFDEAYYLEQNIDVAKAGMDPLDHFILYGAAENRRPCAEFDTRFYREQMSGSKAASENPLLNYVRGGEAQGRAPSPGFDPLAYGAAHPDIAQSGVSPLWHHRFARRNADARRRLTTVLAPPPRIELPVRRQRQWQRPSGGNLGVNLIGPLEIVSGLGVSARGYLRTLEAAGVPTHTVPWRAGFEHQRKIPFERSGRFAAEAPQPINIIHLNADILHFAMPRLAELVTADRYNIGIWYWELASFRPDWMEWIGLLDEIWCSSDFAARAIASNSSRPVKVVRPAIAIPPPSKTRIGRRTFGLRPDAFVFYYNFDVGSNLQRKNPLALAEAFAEEFAGRGDVQLLLKMHYSRADSAEAQRLIALVRSRSNILILDKSLSDSEMAALWSLIDCYVSPHRSEGLGLTVIEAMLARKPVIGTPYGGVADFLGTETGFPLDYDLVEIAETIEPYPQGFIWADPCKASLKVRMREVLENRARAQAVGSAGSERIRQLFSADVTGRCLARELGRIWRSGAPVEEARDG